MTMLLFASLVVRALGSVDELYTKCDLSDSGDELCLLQLSKPGSGHSLSPRSHGLALSGGQVVEGLGEEPESCRCEDFAVDAVGANACGKQCPDSDGYFQCAPGKKFSHIGEVQGLADQRVFVDACLPVRCEQVVGVCVDFKLWPRQVICEGDDNDCSRASWGSSYPALQMAAPTPAPATAPASTDSSTGPSTREECNAACADITSTGGHAFVNGYGEGGAMYGYKVDGGLHQAMDELCELYSDTWTHPDYGHVSTWDVSQVTSLEFLFPERECYEKFNADINCWDVSSVTNFEYTFFGVEVFDQPLNCWDTSSGTKFASMFEGADVFNQDLDLWDISGTWSTAAMFRDAKRFNGKINAWDTSNVKVMMAMFKRAEQFNRPLDNWNVGGVKVMFEIFKDAKAFDRSLDSWDVTGVLNHFNAFSGADAFSHTNPFA